MSFINRLKEFGHRLGKNVMNVASSVVPYVSAGVRTIANPAFLAQIKGLASQGLDFVKNVATGNPFGALRSGVAIANMGVRTVKDTVKTYKEELSKAKAKRKPQELKMKLPKKGEGGSNMNE